MASWQNSPFAGAQIDWSQLADLPNKYAEGKKWRQDQDLRKAFEGGPPRGADGSIDWDAAIGIISQHDPMAALKIASDRGGGVGVYGTPIYGTDESGSTVLGAIGKDGSFKRLDTGGITPTPGVQWRDFGTTQQPFNSRTAAPIGAPVQNDVAGVESEKAKGDYQGKAQTNLGGTIAKGAYALDLIEKAKTHPGRGTATGMSGTFDPRNYVGGTAAKSFQVLNAQLKGQAFLEAFNDLRGGGAISNAEGEAATAAKARLDLAQSDQEYLTAVTELQAITLRGLIRSYDAAGKEVPDELVQQWNEAEQESGLRQRIPFGQTQQPAQSITGGGRPMPTPQHMQALQQYANEPEARAAFDETYGAGAADHFLSGGR